MHKMDFRVSEIKDTDRGIVSKFIAKSWGSYVSVSRGKMFDTNDLP